jgi:hypothetical protein
MMASRGRNIRDPHGTRMNDSAHARRRDAIATLSSRHANIATRMVGVRSEDRTPLDREGF